MALNNIDRTAKINELEEELLAWTEGRKSWTNSIVGQSPTQDYAWEATLTTQADAAEVVKLGAALVALRAGLE